MPFFSLCGPGSGVLDRVFVLFLLNLTFLDFFDGGGSLPRLGRDWLLFLGPGLLPSISTLWSNLNFRLTLVSTIKFT